MSVQFGRWNLGGRPVDSSYLQKAKDMLAPYGPDGEGAYRKDSIGILYWAFHTTKESRKESQPLVTPSGTVVCWDGRLDNREELLHELGKLLAADATDADIVATAYEAAGTACFARLIGDWAVSVCEPRTRAVVLAKDPIGTRHLYYSFEKDEVTWSTLLDPLVLLAGKTFALEEEYIAGWLSFLPATHLTPYVGIHSVPPSCFIRLESGRETLRRYCDFDPSKRIRYKTDGEYEEHFREVFAAAVRRRLRSDSPVLAELSGGMDSSSIVCMADSLIARGGAETPRLDTISFYDDSEPNWNEKPYFTKVEEKRGRQGCHIDVGNREDFWREPGTAAFVATPGGRGGSSSEAARQFAACMASQGNLVVLSGIGGDEVTGGVPTPAPEIADLLATCQLRALVHQLKAWALNKRKPWVYLFLEAARRFFPPFIVGVPKCKEPAAWLKRDFVARNRAAFRGYEPRLKLFGALPTFQENLAALDGLRRQLASQALPSGRQYEKRYPFLDRTLLEFLYAVPREQLVRPGHRRSLMRRALTGMVPDEVVNRRRKAFVARASLVAISTEASRFSDLASSMASESAGIVEARTFLETLRLARYGQEIPTVTVMRTLGLESWLRNLSSRGILAGVYPKPASQMTHSLPAPFFAWRKVRTERR